MRYAGRSVSLRDLSLRIFAGIDISWSNCSPLLLLVYLVAFNQHYLAALFCAMQLCNGA